MLSRFFSLIITVLCLTLQTAAAGDVQSRPALGPKEADVAALSLKLSKITTVLKRFLPQAEVFIGGGAGRALIDHTLYGEQLRFRDLDLQILTHQKLSLEKAMVMQAELYALDFNIAKRDDSKPDTEIFLNDGRHEIDISFFETREALANRGLFNVDVVKVRLPQSKSLASILNAIRADGFYVSLAKGNVFDIANGYRDWRDHRPALRAHTGRVGYWIFAIRAARTLAKTGTAKVPESFMELAEKLKGDNAVFYRRSWTKMFLKLLSDESPALGLRALAKLGGMSAWSPSVQARIEKMNDVELRALLTPDDPIARYEKLISLAPISEHSNLYWSLRKVAPEAESRWRQTRTCGGFFR